jgi:hypothetical protein
MNRLPPLILALGGGGMFGLVGFVWYYFSPQFTDVGYAPRQPVAYSHKQHAGNLGMDCRYCHTNVERSPYANIPASQTCMNCHASIRADSPNLQVVRDSWANNKPVPWVRVYKVPDFVHFPHDVHVNRGVGCVSCHGRVDQMVTVRQATPLSMAWCLECHRQPEKHIRPLDRITQMDYVPTDKNEGQRLVKEMNIKPPEHCSACHY